MEMPYDFGPGKQAMVASRSLIDRIRPSASTLLSTKSTTPYVTHLISTSDAQLLSYSDDGFFRSHDKATLTTLNAAKWNAGGDCTCIVSAGQQGYMATGRNGLVGCWDARQDREVACLAGPSHAPYLSLASSGHLIAAGTELQGVDAAVDIWDLRQTSKPLVSYVEAHSDDVTSLSFHPVVAQILLSASSDSLVAVSDTRKTDEDDSVLGVVNTGASVARAGWGGCSTLRPKTALEGEEATQFDVPPLGAFWSVSDMQTVGIWEADGWEQVLAPRDVRNGEAAFMAPEWRTEYVVDASADGRLINNSSDSLGLFCGNQDGSTALIEVPNDPDRDWIIHCRLRGAHSEVVRSVLWDLERRSLFTGAEDGQICAWQLEGEQQPFQPLSLSTQQPSTGARKEERSRTTYKPY